LSADQRLIHLSDPTGQTSILTTLLHSDSDKGTLIFDGTSDEALSRQITAAKTLHFEASENGVRISFKTGPATSCIFEDRPALLLPVPDEVIRVQRREAFRVATPVNNPVLCTILTPNGEITLPLEDLSSTGLGAADPAGEFTANVGEIFPDCTLELPEAGPIRITLRFVHLREFERSGKVHRHLGFAFEGLRGAALARIQRFVSVLERETLARSRGFQ